MKIDMSKRDMMEMAYQLAEANNKKKATIMQWHSDFVKRYS